MAEIETALLEKVHRLEGAQSSSTLVGFLRPRKKRVGTLIEAKDGQSMKELKREVKKRGGKKLKVYQEINTLYAEMPVDQVNELTSVACAQKVYDAEGDIKLTLNESVPLVMGVEKFELPYRFKHRKLEGQGIKVAVIDSGVDKTHPDFGWRIKQVKNFSGGHKYKGIEHGTHVAGIIGGSGKASGYRYVGVAPRVNLYVGKVFINSETPTSRPIIIDAILWAVRKKVDIINMSFGDSQGCSDGTCILCKTADYASRQGITVVAAAGNGGPAEGSISCPGNARRAITVGATTKTKPVVVAGFSGRGSPQQPNKPDVVAPGDRIIATQPSQQYVAMSGTSMAAPHVSGIVALLSQAAQSVTRKSRPSPEEMKQFLTKAGHDLGEHSTAQGKGFINFEHELAELQTLPKSFWFSKKKSSAAYQAPPGKSPLLHPASTQITAIPFQTCPSALKGFCPHYNPDSCNENYTACIHYQAINQTKVLEHVKLHPDEPAPPVLRDTLKPVVSVSPQNLGSRRLWGKVVGSIHGEPLRGVKISVGDRSTTSDGKGGFSLPKAGRGHLPVFISSPNTWPRSATVKNTFTTVSVKLDAIEKNGSFDLQFYRELVRGYHPQEWNSSSSLQPIHRWIASKPPVIYIDTNKSHIEGGRLTRKTQSYTREAVHHIVPILSGGMYKKVQIRKRRFPTQDSFLEPDFSQIPENSIVITFHDFLKDNNMTFYGIARTCPEILFPAITCLHKVWIFVNTQEKISLAKQEDQMDCAPRLLLKHIVAHELGHGFGYRHTNKEESIMNKDIKDNFIYLPEDQLFCDADATHMRIMYRRPVGNFDIDNDPIPGETIQTQKIPTIGQQLFVDKW